MECGECNFGEMLKNRKLAGDRVELMKPLRDIANFVKHLHDKDLVHCDIKPQNVVRMASGDIKGIDLDGAAKEEKGFFGSKISSAFLPPECVDYDETQSCHVKPSAEGERRKPAKRTSDIWQFGTLLYCAMAGQDLFKADHHDNLADDDDLKKIARWTDIDKRQRLAKVKDVEARSLLDRILCKEPERRPTIEEILEDDFFQLDGTQRALYHPQSSPVRLTCATTTKNIH